MVKNKEFKCIGCGKKFDKQASLNGHMAKCENYQNKINNILTEEFLYENIIVKKHPLNYIAKVILKDCGFEISASKIIRHAKKHKIETPSLKDSANNKHVRERYRQTCLEKYGVDNISKMDEIQKKKEKTWLKNYGVDNIWKLVDYIEQKRFEKRGAYKTAHIKDKIIKHSGALSKPHECISTILSDLNIKHKNELIDNRFLAYNEYMQREYCPRPDIFIESLDVVIECYGDYWHCNPKLYKENDARYTWEGKKQVSDIWKRDESRTKQLNELGYQVIIIWESETCDKVKLTKKIQEQLKLNQ